MRKKIGIITMHRVLNYGSALQAYSLQHAVQQLGGACELIDYYYPNKNKAKKRKKIGLYAIAQLYYKYFELAKKKLFNTFYTHYYSLSKISYMDKDALFECPPEYDIYITGSDQVWNVYNLKEDTSFLLSFAPIEAKKISYAASFSIQSMPDQYKTVYKQYLSGYDSITVREEGGRQIVKSLTGIEAEVFLDPIFLLNDKEWNSLIILSKLQVKEPYILVYVLAYAYNPYPDVTKLIKRIKRQNKMHIVLLSISNRQAVTIGCNNVTNLHDAVSPIDFLKLFKNASFIITTSFHGVCFSLNFSKSFLVVLDDDPAEDDRIYSLLTLMGAENRAIKKSQYNMDIKMEMNYSDIREKIEEYRKRGKQYLLKHLFS
jgi:polysaccharide pyruvyl transferase WcaK-like protein